MGAESADQFSPKVVRSSMGSVFRVKVLYKQDLAGFIKENFSDIDIYAADSNAKTPIEKLKHGKKFGIVFGSESHGLSDELQELVKDNYILDEKVALSL